MHVLVTGATGFVGLHTVLALRRAGHSVRLGVRNKAKMDALYARHGVVPDNYAVGEVTDKAAVQRALDGCDAVVHTAALVSMDPARAQLMYDTNVRGTEYVIGGAVDNGIRSIVHVSSAAALFDPALEVIDENTALARPQSPYARSKADAERHVQGLLDNGANIAITYPTGVIGPDDPAFSEGNQSLRFILKNFHIHTTSGLQVIDVRDLALSQCRLLEGQHSGRFIAAGHYRPWRKLGQELEEITGRRLLKIPAPGGLLRAAGRVVDLLGKLHRFDTPVSREAMEFATRWVYCDDSTLRSRLALEYRPLRETLRDTVAWLVRENHVPEKWGRNLGGG